jgi:beta-lactamase superfamily II metal-dependent hydrolase
MATRKSATTTRTPKPTATPAKRASRKPATTVAAASVTQNDATSPGTIRVRMYRVGFGDFFLLTVPGVDGDPAHILIDCGVHAANIGSMDECVKDMKKETNNRLALVILTHYHADHMSGFASNYDDFASFDHVGAVWITNRLDPSTPSAAAFMAQLTSVATQLQLQLGAREDDAGQQARAKVENALGVTSGGGSNAKALKLLQSGFTSKPPVYYYQGGDEPTLPAELQGMITAEILGPSGPSRKDSGGEFAASDDKTEQYLAAAGDDGVAQVTHIKPFEKAWPGSAVDYPESVFEEFHGARHMEQLLTTMSPDALAAAADALDGTLNNQSLVVLFTCQGKKLLFVGDAQWGNWASWLYGHAVTGADPGISDSAKSILGSIDFYKVGHHGSTNATPIPAVGALNQQCVAMCSTATGAYGDPAKKTEVPRTALMDALEQRTGNRLVRSDWVAAANSAADPEAKAELAQLPPGFSTPGQLYIDYVM